MTPTERHSRIVQLIGEVRELATRSHEVAFASRQYRELARLLPSDWVLATPERRAFDINCILMTAQNMADREFHA